MTNYIDYAILKSENSKRGRFPCTIASALPPTAGRGIKRPYRHFSLRLLALLQGGKKMKKKLCALALCVIMVVALAVPAFAIDPSLISWDTSHGRQLGCNSTGTYVLNQYTGGAVTSGNYVTTWTDTRDATQFWAFPSLANGGYLFVPWSNHSLSINIYWAESTPQVNVYSIASNGYYDAAITMESEIWPSSGAGSFLASITPSPSYGKRYIFVTGENTSASDGHGTSKIVRWNTSATRLYDFDNRQVASARARRF